MTQDLRAFAYIRLSTEAQSDGDGLRRQRELAQRYCEREGLRLDLIEDVGVSAFRGRNASEGALAGFLDRVRNGQIPPGTRLLVESLDRLSRQAPEHALALLLELINHGVRLVSLNDGRTYAPGTNDSLALISSVVVLSRAHEESLTKSRRLSEAWESKRRGASTRILTRQAPAWVIPTPDKSGFVLDAVKADIVRQIFEDCAGGMGAYAIAADLNRRRVPGIGRSPQWAVSYVKKMIKNREVLGEFQPHRRSMGKRIPEGSPIQGYFPKVVDDDLFVRATAATIRRRSGSGGRKGAGFSNLFAGLVHCYYCGGPMYLINKGDGSKGGRYLVCERSRRGLCSVGNSWRYDAFEASFISFVSELNLQDLGQSQQLRSRSADLRHEVESLRARLTDVEERQRRLLDAIEGGAGEVAELSKRLRRLEEERLGDKLALAPKEIELRATVADDEGNDPARLLWLLKRLQQKDDATFRLRAQVSERLKSAVHSTFVLAKGSAPDSIAIATRKLDEGPLPPSEKEAAKIRVRARYLSSERFTRPGFLVMLKSGDIRVVYPSEADPLVFTEMITRSKMEHLRYRPGFPPEPVIGATVRSAG